MAKNLDEKVIKYLRSILSTPVADWEELTKGENGEYKDKNGTPVEFRGNPPVMIKNGEPVGERGKAIKGRKKKTDEGYTVFTKEDLASGKVPNYLKQAWANHECPALSPNATNVYIADDPNNNVWVRYKTVGGGSGTIQNPVYKAEQDRKKWELVAYLREPEHIKKIDDKIEELLGNEKTQQIGTVLLLMRLMGVRVGAVGNKTNVAVEGEDGKPKKGADGKVIRVSVPTYGATTLLGKHICKEEDGVWLHFLGKDGQQQDHKVTDKRLARLLLKAKKQAKGDENRIFKVSETQTNNVLAKLSQEMGWKGDKDMHNHNLRHIKANEVAEREIKKWIKEHGGLPHSYTEYHKAVLAVCKVVSSVLGNKPAQARESYIAPSAWKRMQRKGINYEEGAEENE